VNESIDDGPALILGIDFTLGRPEPVDLRLAFNTLSDEELDAAALQSVDACTYLACRRAQLRRNYMDDALRDMFLDSAYDTMEEFLASLEVPDCPEPPQFPRY
jgi:hypothetical protein